MNSFKKIFVVLFLLVFCFNFASAQTSNFYRNLTVGDVGNDVLELQKILNKDPDTRIAISGVGSSGNETNYFGTLTKNALIKFQNKYKQQILTPAGLNYGTGYFGPSTRNYLNSLNFETTTSEPTINLEPENTTTQLTTDSSAEIYFSSKEVFEVGDEIVLVGTGINKNSTIYFSNQTNNKIVDDLKIDYNFITFNVPSLEVGNYQMFIKNGNSISKPFNIEVVNDYNPPKISSIESSGGGSISYGDTVTIKGSNFSSQNFVITSLGVYQATANNNEIKIYIQRPVSLNNQDVEIVESKVKGLIQVKNVNGISDAEIANFIYN